jgi:hypothetical protein
MNRRIFGMLSKRLDELGLDEIDDTRDDRGKRWRLGTLLRATLGAMVAGAKSLAKVEALSERMSRPTRRLLGVQRRLPDTTLRNALCTIEPDKLLRPLHDLVRKAQRRKALEPNDLPFGVVSLDGKGFSIPSTDDWYAQRQTQGHDSAIIGIVRTVTATLTSSAAKPIIDVTSISAPTNEMGVFELALDSLCCAWLLVARRHWGVETSHQILDNAFEEDDHPWIEACPRAALVVAILRRIAYTMLALFRSVTQRSDERRAAPWETLMTDLFVALISTTELDLREPKPLRLR